MSQMYKVTYTREVTTKQTQTDFLFADDEGEAWAIAEYRAREGKVKCYDMTLSGEAVHIGPTVARYVQPYEPKPTKVTTTVEEAA